VRKEYYWYTGYEVWALSEEVRYLYDGMRVIQERTSGNTPTVSYTRGLDLSGSLEGAGGIGGLLGRSHGYSSGNWSTHNHYHADGNGNVTYLVNSSQGEAASYRYDPYGRVISWSGSLTNANVYRFSSKEIHAKSGMYYYGYRFYEPHLQRWLNRDPIEERGGINLYGFVGNDPTNYVDPEGEFAWVPIIKFCLAALGAEKAAEWAAELVYSASSTQHTNEAIEQMGNMLDAQYGPGGWPSWAEAQMENLRRRRAIGAGREVRPIIESPGTFHGGPAAKPRPRPRK
jgi:RHS repeat-associated protein